MTAPAPGVEVGALIDSRPLSRVQIRIMVFCGLVMLLDGYDVQVMALAVPSVSAMLHARPSDFSLALSASLIGLGLGAAFIAPFGDRLGRRPVMVGALALCGLATLGTALSHGIGDFVFWRLLTGLGIGGSIANATALTSEYMPSARRTWLVCVMYCNIALGGFFAGLLAPLVLDHSDWRGLFLLGGAGTVAAAALVWAFVPESLKFLIARKPGHRRIAAVLASLAPGTDPASVYVAPETARRRRLWDLLGAEYRTRTLLLWLIYTGTAFIIFVLTSWLPTLLGKAGWPRNEALVGSVLFQLGGVAGSLLLSLLVDRGRVRLALGLGYALCAGALAVLVLSPPTFVVWAPLMLLIGVGISGAQCVVVAIAAAFYPLAIRATGVGWAVTVARLGAVSAPLVGGALVQLISPVQLLALLIVPALICAVAATRVRQAWLFN